MNYMNIRECDLLEAVAMEAHVRGRQHDLVVDLLMAGPLPASSKIFVGLDDGAQTCVRVIALPLNSIGNEPRKVFRCLDTGRSSARMSKPILAHRRRTEASEKTLSRT
jgi:hypothetical protein